MDVGAKPPAVLKPRDSEKRGPDRLSRLRSGSLS